MKQNRKKSNKSTGSRAEIEKLNKVVRKVVGYFKPPETLTVSEWADKYRRLSPENSAEPGKWKTSRTPYLKDIMDAFTDPNVHRITVAASSQVGKSEMEMNIIGYCIDNDPGPMMFVMPSIKPAAEDFAKRRIAPMIRDTPSLRSKVSEMKAKTTGNTVMQKSYPGGMLTITGANSPNNLASTPCRYVFGDERDRWTQSAGSEGDPWGLLEARTITFFNYKMVEVSTPTIKGASAIETAFYKGTQEYWSAKCPHCDEYIYPRFTHMRFTPHCEKVQNKKQWSVSDIALACPECGCQITESEFRKADKKWVAVNPAAYEKGWRSFWINAFCSPWMSWDRIILKFLECDGDPNKLQTVYNTYLGELWENRGDLEDESGMLKRREIYNAELPDGVLCLTCGVDTQDNRLEYEVVGYGFGEENWGIEKGMLMGDPDTEEPWEKLDAVIDRVYKFQSGKGLKISVTFVDSGGHKTQSVYKQCKRRIGKRVFACKGYPGQDKPYTKPPSIVKIVQDDRKIGNTYLYMIGVDAGKQHIMSGLKITEYEPGKRYSHFPSNAGRGYDEMYFNGLLSETMTYKNGKWTWEKIPGHQRNEPLDLRNYANAAFVVLKPNLEKLYQQINGIVVSDTGKVKKKKQQKKRRISDYDW